MFDFLAISIGAVLGASLRYWMSRSTVRWLGPAFPYSTLAINVIRALYWAFSSRGRLSVRLLTRDGAC